MKKTALLLALLLLLSAFTACTRTPSPSVDPSDPAEPGTVTDPVDPGQTDDPAQTDEPGTPVTPAPGDDEPDPVTPGGTDEPGTDEPGSETGGDTEKDPAAEGQLSAYIDGSNQHRDAVLFEAPLRSTAPEISFMIYYDDTDLEAVFDDNAYRFAPLDEERQPAVTFLEISLINGITANALMPSFMDAYIDFTDIEFSSYSSIGADKVNTNRVVAYNEEQYVEAYLIDVSGGVVAVVLSAPAAQSHDLLWFEAMLSTFRLS